MKVNFYWKEKPFSQNNLIHFFILIKQFFNFPYFLFEIFLSHNLCIYIILMCKYLEENLNNDSEYKKLNPKLRWLVENTFFRKCLITNRKVNYKSVFPQFKTSQPTAKPTTTREPPLKSTVQEKESVYQAGELGWLWTVVQFSMNMNNFPWIFW